MKALLPALLFLSVFVVYLRSLSPSVSLEDTGELIACAVTLGNSHPPGYPWHAMLGKLWALLPVGAPAFRLNLMSAACGAAATLVLWRLLAGLAPRFGLSPTVACLIGSTAFAFSRTAWWQSTIAEKYALAVVLFAGAAATLFRAVCSRDRRGVLMAVFLSGLALSHHGMGLYLMLPCGWLLWTVRSRRLMVLACLLLLLPLGAKALYPPIRAVQHPPINWGVPDRLSRAMDYLSAKRYTEKFLLQERSAEGLMTMALDHVGVMPWREMGLTVLLGLAGFVVVWRQERRLAQAVLMLIGVNLALALMYQTPEIERYYMPSAWVLGVLAGLGGGWMAARWHAGVGLAAMAILLEAFASSSFAVRDRSYAAADHVRNMLALVPANSLIIAWGDPWLFPLWHARIVERLPAARRVLTAEALVFDVPERAQHGPELGGEPGRVSGYQEGPALLWALASLNAPRKVYLTHGAQPAQVPSRGARWSGFLIEVTDPEKPFEVDDVTGRWLRGVRLRSLLAPRGMFEQVLASYYAAALHAQAQLCAQRGASPGAYAYARMGLRLNPRLPELHYVLGRAQLLDAKPDAAAAAWDRALRLTRGTYFDPFLGLAALARLQQNERDQELEYLRAAAALAVGGQHALMAEADEARAVGDAESAERGYRRGIAEGLLSRGLVYFRDGKLPQAASAWTEALKFNGELFPAMHNLGALAALEERFVHARRWFQAALKLNPQSVDLQNNLTRAREAVEAKAGLARLTQRAGGPARDPAGLCELGNVFWYLGRGKVAESCYRRALALDASYVRAWGNLGSALVYQGRVQEAIKVYRLALRARPDYAEAMVNLGAVYQGLNDPETALMWVRRALAVKPDDPQALRLLAELTGSSAP